MSDAGRLPLSDLVRAVALTGLLVLVLAATAVAAPGDVETSFDGHDTVVATAPASPAPFSTTLTYDSSAFTTTATERDVNGTSDGIYTNMTGCGASPPYWGGRSGWVRFDSPVSGTLRVDVSTGGYDPFIVVEPRATTPRGTGDRRPSAREGACRLLSRHQRFSPHVSIATRRTKRDSRGRSTGRCWVSG